VCGLRGLRRPGVPGVPAAGGPGARARERRWRIRGDFMRAILTGAERVVGIGAAAGVHAQQEEQLQSWLGERSRKRMRGRLL
jgi:hypothetical protein